MAKTPIFKAPLNPTLVLFMSFLIGPFLGWLFAMGILSALSISVYPLDMRAMFATSWGALFFGYVFCFLLGWSRLQKWEKNNDPLIWKSIKAGLILGTLFSLPMAFLTSIWVPSLGLSIILLGALLGIGYGLGITGTYKLLKKI